MIETRRDEVRGCGWRKEGGLYLVSGQLSEPCSLLPYETSVCQTCGEGIRPARGFTWVDGEKFIPPVEHDTPEHTAVCPLAPEGKYRADGDPPFFAAHVAIPANDHPQQYVSRLGRCGLIWVGEQHYKTAADFVYEANRLGVSRRITAVPKDFEVGKTWVLLGHRKAIKQLCPDCPVGDTLPGGEPDCPLCEGTGTVWLPGVVTAFRPTAIEYVVKGDETDGEIEALEKRGITAVRVERIGEQEAMV